MLPPFSVDTRVQFRKNLLSKTSYDLGDRGSRIHYTVIQANVHRYYRGAANFYMHFRLFQPGVS